MSANKLRFFHASDLHLDTPFQGIAKTSEEIAATLRDASIKSLDNLVAEAIKMDASFVVLSGDIYDGVRYGVRGRVALSKAVGRLLDSRIKLALILGNHDATADWDPRKELPQETIIFDSPDVRRVRFLAKDGSVIHLYGTSYQGITLPEEVINGFSRVPEDGLHVGLLHCTLRGSAGGSEVSHQEFNLCAESQLFSCGLDYWALGHIHARKVFSSRHPYIVYSGNLQGRSAKPSELGEKGAYCVEVSMGQVVGLTFVPCDSVRFLSVSVEVGELTDPAAIIDRIVDSLNSLREKHQGRGLVVRVELGGRGPAHALSSKPQVRAQLEMEVRDVLYQREPFCWLESLRDSVTPDYNLEQIKRRGDFSSELLSLSEEIIKDSERSSAFLEESLAQLYSFSIPPALRERLIKESSTPQLIEGATLLALELLEEENSK